MKVDLIRCPHCGLPHPRTERTCPVTGEALPGGEPAPPDAPAAAAHLVVKTADGQQHFQLAPMNSLGRHPSNSIQILDKIVSKEHCLIELRGARYVLRDLGSLNGTFVNNVRVRGEAPLADGDEITLGATRIVFRSGSAEAPPAPAPRPEKTPAPVPVVPEAAERLVAHLASDKPLYRPGETLYARAALLDAFTRAPAMRGGTLAFEVRSPRGDVVVSRPGLVSRGVSPLSWEIPADLAGGDYILYARCPSDSFAPSELPFAIRAYRVPRLKLELELGRKAYGPGDEVTAALSVTRAEGGLPRGATAEVFALLDGAEIHRAELPLDASGELPLRFRLPAAISEGEGTLAVTVRDGGVSETIARTIPVVLNRIALALYPEGGDLVAGLPGRLYVQARTPRGKPADVAGRILDGTGAVLGRFRTEHEGRGRATFTPPKSGRAYMAVLDEPAGVSDLFPLPEVMAGGFSLLALDDVTAPEEAVRLRVTSASSGRARVALFSREREVAALRLQLTAGEARDVALTPPGSADGVLRATVFDAAGLPRAERLVFRRPLRSLRVEVELTPPRAGLRAPIALKVKTMDAEGRPVPASVLLAVTDDAVLETLPRRERPPRLPEQALLGGEVIELGDPRAYLDEGDEPARKLDLLLGTQGYRRFAFHDTARFLSDHGDLAERVLARLRPPAPALAQTAMLVPLAPAAKGGAPLLQAPAPAGAPPPLAAPPPAAATGPRAPIRPAPAPMVAPQAAPPLFFAAAPEPALARAEAPRALAIKPPPIVVREYAHRAAGPFDGVRTDFAETLYWNAAVTTPPSGEVLVTFDLADAVTSFRARADAVGADGALGAGDALVEARRPFHVEPRLPLEVSAGDVIELPVAVVNGTAARAAARVSLVVSGPLIAASEPASISVDAESRERMLLPVAVSSGRGTFPITLRATAGRLGDEVTRSLSVVPAGFPVAIDRAGRLDADGSTTFDLALPETFEPGSLSLELSAYPSPLATLAGALAALLSEPCGCFEQASSSAYPNLMVQRYLATHHGADPKLLARSAELVGRGYEKLAGFECKERGYEWFGGDPGHEALTAYGLMELTEMAEVHPVDAAMLGRTREWLLARRDGQGGFQRNPRALDSFGAAPADVTDAYVTWALGQAGTTGLESEVARVRGTALGSDDAYYLALAANVLAGTRDPATEAVLEKLAGKQSADGALRRAATSITRSGGDNLVVETTALAALAFLATGRAEAADRAVGWIVERCRGGRFGATQATVLALKAILAADAAAAKAKRPGSLTLRIDGETLAELSFDADQASPLVLSPPASTLMPGERRVEIRQRGGGPLPWSLRVGYATALPPSSPGCALSLATALGREEIGEGEAVDLAVELANATSEGLPMTVAIIGVPGGLEARADQLQELVKLGSIDAWELRGREVVLYRRSLAPGEKLRVSIALLGAVPGTYSGPASRAYLYYTDDSKVWAAPLEARVVAKR